MKLRIGLALSLCIGLLAFIPVSNAVHTEGSSRIESRAQKCIITLSNKNSRATIRASQNQTSRVVAKLRDGVYVNVTKRSRGWVYINGSDQGSVKGWLPERYISC
jgi:SH3-like domain-containing protein